MLKWTHTTFYLLDDHFGPSETTYGWHHALQLPAEDAVHDSESYGTSLLSVGLIFRTRSDELTFLPS